MNEGVVVCVRVIMQKMELRYQWEHGTEKKKFIERKAFIDTVGIKSDDLKKDKFCFRFLFFFLSSMHGHGLQLNVS